MASSVCGGGTVVDHACIVAAWREEVSLHVPDYWNLEILHERSSRDPRKVKAKETGEGQLGE